MMAKIGVLALQGAFREHVAMLHQIGVEAAEVRLPADLDGLDGLIIPGGESTTMGHLATAFGLVEPLRRFSRSHPVWGTCAGMILLADRANGQKQGGQPLIGGLDISVDRNFFGRQVASFEVDLAVPALAGAAGGDGPLASGSPAAPFHAVFIRAPAVIGAGPGVEVLAALPGGPVVAVRQGHLLATAFHPELGSDLRFHRFFAAMVTGRRAGLLPVALPVSANGQRHPSLS